MGASAVKILHDDVGAVWLERDAVVCVDDDRVLDDDAIGTICVPTIRVGDLDSIGASGYEVHVADYHVRCVGDHVEPLLTAVVQLPARACGGVLSCHCLCRATYIG